MTAQEIKEKIAEMQDELKEAKLEGDDETIEALTTAISNAKKKLAGMVKPTTKTKKTPAAKTQKEPKAKTPKPVARLADGEEEFDGKGERVSGEAEIIKKALSLHDGCEKGNPMTPKKWQIFYYMLVRHIKAKKVRQTGGMAKDMIELQKIALHGLENGITEFGLTNENGKIDEYRAFVKKYYPEVKIPAKYRETVPLSGAAKKPLSKTAFKRRMAAGKAKAAAAREAAKPAPKKKALK